MFIAKENDVIIASSTYKENLEEIGFSNVEEVADDNPDLEAFLGLSD